MPAYGHTSDQARGTTQLWQQQRHRYMQPYYTRTSLHHTAQTPATRTCEVRTENETEMRLWGCSLTTTTSERGREKSKMWVILSSEINGEHRRGVCYFEMFTSMLGHAKLEATVIS